MRNTRVIDIYHALQEYNADITVFDPWASPERVKHEYGIDVVNTLPNDKYSAAIIAVAHRQFREMEIDFEKLLEPNHVIYDVKAIMPRNLVDGRL